MHKDKYIVITVLVTTNSSYCHLNWLNQTETTCNCESNLVILVRVSVEKLRVLTSTGWKFELSPSSLII